MIDSGPLILDRFSAIRPNTSDELLWVKENSIQEPAGYESAYFPY